MLHVSRSFLYCGCSKERFLTLISALPEVTILLNMVKMSSFSSNFAGLDVGPTRTK